MHRQGRQIPHLGDPCVENPSSAGWTTQSVCHSRSSDIHKSQSTLRKENIKEYQKDHQALHLQKQKPS